MFKSPKEHEVALHELYAQSKQAMLEFDQKAEQGMGQLKQIDKLVEAGAIKDPDETKWRLVLGPEAEKAMFTEQRDPRLEHRDILAEEKRMLDNVGAYAMGRDGKLYHAKLDDKGYYTDKPDKSTPATQQEASLWMSSAQALDVLGQQKLGLVEQMAQAGIPNPNRLQDLMISSEKEHWLKRAAKGYAGLTMGGIIYKGVKRVKQEFGPEPTGTFAQKVQEDVAKPQSRVQQPQRKRSRQELLTEYRNLGGGNTVEGRTFADKNLR